MSVPRPFPEKGHAEPGASVLEAASLPAAALLQTPLAHNIGWMQAFAESHGCRLAPHGKTTMTPALFRRQMEAGAWGITLATATQCAAAFGHGITRLLMANQLVGAANMAIVSELIAQGADFYCLVDSLANAEALDRFFAERGQTLQVLIELGVAGGRCGVRTMEQLDALADAVHAAPALRLCGIEGYEGMIGGPQAVSDVSDYGRQLLALLDRLRQRGVLDLPAPIVTASGSKWFDLIAGAFDQAGSQHRCTPLLRPGCYVAHDHRLYRDAMAQVKQRQPQLQGELQPALVVFARVQSLPEPGLAVVALGKRDISCDPDLPVALALHRPGQPAQALPGHVTRHVMDQHCLLAIPADSPLQVGDVLAFGASHPCLTFDKWRQILLLDDDLRVLDVLPTWF